MVGTRNTVTMKSSEKKSSTSEVVVVAAEEKQRKTYRRSPARQEVPRTPTKPKSPSRPSRQKTSPSRQNNVAVTRTSPVETRRRSISRSRTERGNKSPATSTPISKSPVRLTTTSSARAPKSPARKPIRKTESTESSVKKVQTVVLDSDSDSDDKSESSRASSKPLSLLRKSPMVKPLVQPANTVTRRSSRLKEPERVLHLKPSYEPAITKVTEFSDEDDFEIVAPQVVKVKLNYAKLFEAVLRVVLLPVMLFGMLALCNEKSCRFAVPDLKQYMDVEVFFDLPVFLSYTAYVLFNMIFSTLPFGGYKCTGPVCKSGRLEYVMNGFLLSVVIVAIMGVLEFYRVHVCAYVLDNFFKLTVASYLLALPIGLALYVKSLYAPIGSVTDSSIGEMRVVNFILGSEINPRFFGILDIKMTLIRTAYISLLILTLSCIYCHISASIPADMTTNNWLEVLKSLNISPTLLVICTLFLIYSLDNLVFEHTRVFTYEMQYKTMGYFKCAEYSLVALFVMVPKYVLDYKVELPTWQLVMSTVLFMAGYLLYRLSNSQKHSFRSNPYSPLVAHLESIPTQTGKKLICSGLWGRVRHPNYLGDILMNFAFLPFVLCQPPCIILYMSNLGLVQRALEDNAHCKQRYGSSWNRYCQRVKYTLVPKVY